VKLPDVNVLLAAVNEDCVEHSAVRAWLEDAFNQPAGVALAWAALLGFIRLSTKRGILERPLSVSDALSVVQTWIEAPRATLVNPTSAHGPLVARLLLGSGAGGNLTTDAHLAALAIEHGALLGSFDRDFDRFEGLRFERLKP
jgi:toxin-antitoxin system PIN domain toxin